MKKSRLPLLTIISFFFLLITMTLLTIQLFLFTKTTEAAVGTLNIQSGGAPATATTMNDTGGISASDTSVTVTSVSGYPTAGTLLIDSEAITYTGVSSNTFTGLGRGAFGTTAATHADGSTVNNYLTIFQATSTTPRFVVTGAGNVGINATAPGYGLEVGGTSRINGNFTIGDDSGDTVTANAAAWTFANDTTVELSGGVNGINFDSNTLSIDATNNRVGIGTAAPAYNLDLNGYFNLNQHLYQDGNVRLDGDAAWVRTYGQSGWYNGTYGGGWYQTGTGTIISYASTSISTTMPTGGSSHICHAGFGLHYICSSDARLKENIRYFNQDDQSLGIDLVNKLKPVFFDWKPGKGDKNNVGFIAQDLIPVLPEGLVKKSDIDGYYRFSQEELMPYAVQALQEMDKTITKQQKEIEQLKEQVATISKELQLLKEKGD